MSAAPWCRLKLPCVRSSGARIIAMVNASKTRTLSATCTPARRSVKSQSSAHRPRRSTYATPRAQTQALRRRHGNINALGLLWNWRVNVGEGADLARRARGYGAAQLGREDLPDLERAVPLRLDVVDVDHDGLREELSWSRESFSGESWRMVRGAADARLHREKVGAERERDRREPQEDEAEGRPRRGRKEHADDRGIGRAPRPRRDGGDAGRTRPATAARGCATRPRA